MNIVDKINNHLRSLAPHIAQRQTATLLRDAVEEIERLRSNTEVTEAKKCMLEKNETFFFADFISVGKAGITRVCSPVNAEHK